MKLYATGEGPSAPAWLTPWSIVHFASGIVAHGVGVYSKLDVWVAFAVWMVVHLLYEAKDQTRARASNSLPNSFADQAVAALGFGIAAACLGRRNTPLVSLLALVTAFVLHTLLGGSAITKLQWW